jgi:uncharacterized damage-inducible protein DinB
MNKQELLSRRSYFDLVHGVTLRAIGALADSELDFRPKPGMRSPRELIFHIYAQEKALAEAARQGELTAEQANASNPEDPSATSQVNALVTVQDAAAFARACHSAADEIFKSLSEEEIARIVESPFGKFQGWQYFLFAYDEHWHHRGQLYSYLRLLGKEPPMLYDYQ